MTIGRIPSVEGGIQPTIVDAKGDLIVATAADTVNRLAVGSNGQILTADSTASTGVKWAAAITYQAFTPTWTNLTIGNGTNNFRYGQIGNFVHVHGKLTFGSTTSVSGAISFAPPVSITNTATDTLLGSAYFNDNSDSADAKYFGPIFYDGTRFVIRAFNANETWLRAIYATSATVPFAWATSDIITFDFVYEA